MVRALPTMDTILGYFGRDRATPLRPIETSMVSSGAHLLGFYFDEGRAVEVLSAAPGGGASRQPASDEEGERWLALDASPTPTSLGPCTPEDLGGLAADLLARPWDGPDWPPRGLRTGVALVAWEATRRRALALRTSATSPSLYLLRSDDGVFVGNTARPFVHLGPGVEPSASALEALLRGDVLAPGSTAVSRLDRLEPNTVQVLEPAASRGLPMRSDPAGLASKPLEAIAQIVRRDAAGRTRIALLAVGPPPVDAALALALSRELGDVVVVEPVLAGNAPVLEGVAGQLGLGFLAREYSPAQALDAWLRILPWLGEPTASLRGLAHLLGAGAIAGAGLYVSSMGLPARLEPSAGPGIAGRLRSLFHRGEATPVPEAAGPPMPQGSHAAFAVLSGLVRRDGSRFSLPLTERSLGLADLTPSDVREILVPKDLRPSVAHLPEVRPRDGFTTFVRDAVLPALEGEQAEGPRWLRHGAAAELFARGERMAKAHPLGPLFLYSLIAWMKRPGADAG